MSSGTPFSPQGAREVMGAVYDKLARKTTSTQDNKMRQAAGRMKRLGLNARQRELNAYYAWYRQQNYAHCKVDWDGKPVMDDLSRDAMADGMIPSQASVPPGFYDAGGQTVPVKDRKPVAASGLVRSVVDRFTGLLFSERHHPEIYIDGNDNDSDYVQTLCNEARLWALCDMARTYGGSMGTAIAGFQFIDGKPQLEVHDPRWCTPIFKNKLTHEVKAIEEKYIFPETLTDDAGGEVEMWFWYRRVITETQDVLYEEMPVGEGDEPDWDNNVANVVDHNLGFCPVVWCQNMPVADAIDGDPDCYGAYDTVHAINLLRSVAVRGTVYNADPTLVISTPDKMDEVVKGSGTALKMTEGDAKYLELEGSGPDAADKRAAVLRDQFLEDVKCVIENPETASGGRTATEIERTYAAMLAQADRLREQYGQKFITPIVAMMLKAIVQLGTPKTDDNGNKVSSAITLPERVVKKDDGTVESTEVRVYKDGGQLQLKWPRYFEITVDDISKAASAAGNAKLAGLIDSEHASRFVAEFFKVTDVRAMLVQIQKEKQQTVEEAQASMAERIRMPSGNR